MKRTKDRFGKFEYYNDHNISSLKVFDGEDLEYQDRMKYQTMQQNAWIQQQKYENEMKRQHEREEERRYAEQTLAINRMRSMLESEHEQKIKDMNCMQKDYNIKLADFKREKEAKEPKSANVTIENFLSRKAKNSWKLKRNEGKKNKQKKKN